MNSLEVFIHIHQGCFAGTGAIVRLPQCQWSKPDGYGKISQCITTTKHSKAKIVCIFLGIYCIYQCKLLSYINYINASDPGCFGVPQTTCFSKQFYYTTSCLTKAWDVITLRYRTLWKMFTPRKIQSFAVYAFNILCEISKGNFFEYNTKFWTHTSQIMHFAECYFSLWFTISWNCDVISLIETPHVQTCIGQIQTQYIYKNKYTYE